MKRQSAYWAIVSSVLSACFLLVVGYLVYGPTYGDQSVDVSFLPHINVILNSLSAIVLVSGYYFIKTQRETSHRYAMITAFILSAAFLTSYVLYHYFQAEPKSYTGDFPWIYFPILIAHILLAAGIAPLILVTIYRGWTDKRPKHKKLAKWTFPLWITVSISGIIIYFMLYGI